MKKLFLSVAIFGSTLLGSFAQLAADDVPALTNNVQCVWGTNQAIALKALWNEDFAGQIAAWNTATNADPTYASSNSVPTKGTFAVWAAAWTKPIMATALAEKEAQRKWRVAQALATSYATAKTLFEANWALLTPAQQATQSNVWWTAQQANQ